MAENLDMDRKIAVITGASSGIGAATAIRLAQIGYHVLLVARRTERIAKLVDGIQADGGKAILLVADLAQENQCQDLIQRIETELGDIGILINNAGFGWYGYSDEMPWATARQMIEVNMASLVNLTLQCLPGMKARRAGHIINVSSIAGSLPSQGIVLYGATKAFVDA